MTEVDEDIPEGAARASIVTGSRTTLQIAESVLRMVAKPVPEEMIERGRLAVQRMIDLPPPAVPARYDMVKARHHVDVELI